MFDHMAHADTREAEIRLRGYNPQKRGRPSYHPQLCRERRTGLSVWSRLRPGNTISSTDFVSFLEESWQVLPKRFRRRRRGSRCQVLARMDSGYESEDALRWLEEHGVGYVVKMRMRRVVMARWGQNELFDALGYSYAVLVTNLDWDEQDVYRFYDKRADVENHIQEAKTDLGIGHIPANDFQANAADLELRLLAINQLVLLSRCVLGQTDSRPRVSTIRRKWLLIPGKLVRDGRRRILKLADWHPMQHLWPLYQIEVALL